MSVTDNCNFLENLVSTLKATGFKIGIQSSHAHWTKIFGGKKECHQFTQYKLWYINLDGKAETRDWEFNSFGEWKSPSMKQYAGKAVVCGDYVNLNYIP